MRGHAPRIGLLAMLSVCGLASAGPEARVRVRGSTRIDATAAPAGTGLIVQGALYEDASRPIPGARLTIGLLARDGSPRRLPRAEPCRPPVEGTSPEPYRDREEASATTDTAGRFCARWSLDLPEGRLRVAFEDERQLLDPSEKLIEVEPRSPLQIEFSPVPKSLSLDGTETAVVLTSYARTDAAFEPLPLALLWTREGSPTTSLHERKLLPGETVTLRFPSRMLGGPGPGELVARLGSKEHTAEARAQVIATTLVTLKVPQNLSLGSSGEGVLRVQVDSRTGPVSSGSVEALLAGRTLGIAPAFGGQAELNLFLGVGPVSAPVLVRYLPVSPWWIAGPAEPVHLTVAEPSTWWGVGWAAALAAIATWLALAWQRPRRQERRKGSPSATPPVEAAVRWIGFNPETHGWTGTVTDAHEGTPLGQIAVSMELAGGARSTALTDRNGTFRLEPPAPGPGGGQLHAEGPWHSPLNRPAPPPGSLAITLVTRRRTLLGRLVDWSRRRGAPWIAHGDPTPAELARKAEDFGEPGVGNWARAVERAAFGLTAVNQAEETRVRSLEPPGEPPRTAEDPG